jgi:hypothetical protein
MVRIVIVFSCIFLAAASFAHASTDNVSEQEKISYLLNVVGTSKVIFVRNGVEYPASEAKAHLQMKLDAAGSAIQTADDFINDIASHSSMTGQPYYVELPDGTKIEAQTWLREMLARR